MSDYEAAWRQYRRLRNWCFALFLAYVPVVFTIAIAFYKLFHTFTPGFVVAGAWMII